MAPALPDLDQPRGARGHGLLLCRKCGGVGTHRHVEGRDEGAGELGGAKFFQIQLGSLLEVGHCFASMKAFRELRVEYRQPLGA